MLKAFLNKGTNASRLHEKILAAGFEKTRWNSSVLNYTDMANNEYRNKPAP
jgi:hypothetical protein